MYILLLDSAYGFHTRGMNERFTAAYSRCRKNPKFRVLALLTTSRDSPKSLPHEQYDYFSSFIKPYHRFVALPLPLPSSFLKLPYPLLLTDLPLSVHVVVKTLNLEISACHCRSSTDYVKELRSSACRTCSTIIFPH